MPEVIAFYDPGADITVQATGGATGGRCLGLPNGQNPGGSAGISDTGDGLLTCPLPAAGAPVFGVASHDAAVNGRVNVLRHPKVVPIECSAVVAQGAVVMTATDGRVLTRTAGNAPVGINLGPATTGAGQYCKVLLFEPAAVGLYT